MRIQTVIKYGSDKLNVVPHPPHLAEIAGELYGFPMLLDMLLVVGGVPEFPVDHHNSIVIILLTLACGGGGGGGRVALRLTIKRSVSRDFCPHHPTFFSAELTHLGPSLMF